MYSDQTYRAFLLRMVDEDTEDAIEDGILDGSVSSGYLGQIEEELIDDFLFGRLSEQERTHFTSEFLSSPQRAGKLRVAAALRSYSVQHSREREGVSLLLSLKKLASIPLKFSLAVGLASILILAVWLGFRNRSLRDELALSKRDDIAARQEIASLQQEKQQRTLRVPTTPSDQSVIPALRLSSVTSRGQTSVPVLRLGKQANVAPIELELPFDPRGKLEEELLDARDQIVWSQRFSDSSSIAPGGITTIMLPAAVLTTGDYRLRVNVGSTGKEYGFRVHKD
jgi:hypothetical protein